MLHTEMITFWSYHNVSLSLLPSAILPHTSHSRWGWGSPWSHDSWRSFHRYGSWHKGHSFPSPFRPSDCPWRPDSELPKDGYAAPPMGEIWNNIKSKRIYRKITLILMSEQLWTKKVKPLCQSWSCGLSSGVARLLN